MDTILIVCGAGASSTFLASRMRNLATQRGLSLVARAASTNDLADRLPSARAMLVGPHLESSFGDLKAQADAHSVPSALLPATAFAADGAADALDLALTLLYATPQNEGPSHG
jgi:PTS system cellobiose-specific IIB component